MSARDLARVLREIPGPHAIAVSGGVDSLTLAAFAHGLAPGVRLYHAVSPAVPPEATSRMTALAAARGWSLEIVDAGEFDDPDYIANPVNRCFFCKSSLYGTLARRVERGSTIFSGTNTDDLGEYRPGLEAAAAHRVRHPFVEAHIGKNGVRALARSLGLGDVAELPSSPCLSSRIETGTPIDAALLALVDAVETAVRRVLGARTVRCRIRAAGMVIELDEAALEAAPRSAELRAALAAITPVPQHFAPYRNGSAFIRRMPADARA